MSDFADSDIETDANDESFAQAADHIQHAHASYMSDELLNLYALYKQATVGRCNTAKPAIFNMQNRTKWNAWHNLRDMSSTEAKRLYVEKVQQLDPKWQCGTKKESSLGSWVVHSVEMPTEAPKAEHEKTPFDYVKEANLERLRESLTPELLHQLDECGMGLIHWASDRNNPDILRFLLDSGADVNFCDSEEQTALHYAASCGHIYILRILLNSNADRFAKDSNGQTSFDVAENDEVRCLLELL